jgi:ABC-type transport system involved in Fe-S cluster assembly fused permease/ATPase subunit
MNAADNKGATVAVDSLINYEAVKVIIQLNICSFLYNFTHKFVTVFQ